MPPLTRPAQDRARRIFSKDLRGYQQTRLENLDVELLRVLVYKTFSAAEDLKDMLQRCNLTRWEDITTADLVESLLMYKRMLRIEECARGMFAEKFRGYQQKRLENLEIELLRSLVKMVVFSSNASAEGLKRNLEHITAVEMARLLVTYKRRLTPAAKDATDPPAPQRGAVGNDHQPAGPLVVAQNAQQLQPQTPQIRRLFVPSCNIQLCTWNCLKMRDDKEELEPLIPELVSKLAEFDVIALQEVRASAQLWARVERLLERLRDTSRLQWQMAVSAKNGDQAPEVHIILAKSPIKIERCHNMTTAGGVPLTNAPFLVLLNVSKLVSNVKNIAVTSVRNPKP